MNQKSFGILATKKKLNFFLFLVVAISLCSFLGLGYKHFFHGMPKKYTNCMPLNAHTKGIIKICDNTPSILNSGVPLVIGENTILFFEPNSKDIVELLLTSKPNINAFSLTSYPKVETLKNNKLRLNDKYVGATPSFDPITQYFWPEISQKLDISQPSMSFISTDSILILGGFRGSYSNTSNSKALKDAWIYGLKSKNIKQIEKAALSRVHPNLILINDHLLLISGGIENNYFGKTSSSAELFLIKENKFIEISPMKNARLGHESTLLANGDILITGGENENGPVYEVELFNVQTKKFQVVGELAQNRINPSAIRLDNEQVFLIGGKEDLDIENELDNNDEAGSDIEVFNVKTMKIGSYGHLNEPRYKPRLTLLNNKRILITGGKCKDSSDPKICSSVELFVP